MLVKGANLVFLEGPDTVRYCYYDYHNYYGSFFNLIIINVALLDVNTKHSVFVSSEILIRPVS